ncbi:MAG TPA: pitrilysin family protein [Mycobacteriales bacterium]|nr:pitrilysin family protein [Mycobacteriales bacterium]
MTRRAPGFRRTTLPGGLRVVTEAVPGVRSAAFGVWVGVGSRDERPAEAGASHFLEHLLFKGTTRRTALDIAAVMDAVGGELNAFTAKEYTCFYARVLDTDLPLAVDVVSDIVTSATCTVADVEAERGVILEEVSMHDDDPGDVVHDAFAEALYGEHPLGRPVIGSVESIEGLTHEAITHYYRHRYTQPEMVVSVAGRVDHDQVVALVEAAFGASPAAPPVPLRPPAPPARLAGAVVEDRPTEQAHLVLGTHGLARDDERRWALSVLNNGLGGGMSSRLFQEVRENRGLAYSVYSYASHHHDTGMFGVYAGCAPSKVDEVLRVCRDELAAVADKGLSDDEIARAKGQLRGSLVLGLEDTGSQMTRIGKAELVHGSVLDVDEVLARIDDVTTEDVRDVAADVLRRPLSLGIIGPFPDRDFTEVLS